MSQPTDDRESRLGMLSDVVEDNVSWQRGRGYEWECDAVIGYQTLADLVTLASYAPSSDLALFLEKWAVNES